MLDAIIEPFTYPFMVRGMLAAILAGALCGGIGVYVILKRMAYIGHGLSHAVLGGAVVSFVMSFNFLIGSTIWGFLCAQLITLTTKKRKIAYDAAIGVITTSSFAIGIVLISRNKSFTRDFETALFGNITGVFPGDLVALAVVAGADGFGPVRRLQAVPVHHIRRRRGPVLRGARPGGWRPCSRWCWPVPSWSRCRCWEYC